MRLSLVDCLSPRARLQFEVYFKRVHLHCAPYKWQSSSGFCALLAESIWEPIRSIIKVGLILYLSAESGLTSTQFLSTLSILLRGTVNIAASIIFLGLGKILSAIQTSVGLEPPGRSLSVLEKQLLRSVFQDALDLESLKIKEGASGLADLTDRPFVHGHVLYLHNWPLESAILVHEAVHWWQYQHGGSDYIIDSIWSQYLGKGYNWAESFGLVPWNNMETEQQAQLIEDAFRSGFFESGTFEVRGQDMTNRMEDVLESLRAGSGAP